MYVKSTTYFDTTYVPPCIQACIPPGECLEDDEMTIPDGLPLRMASTNWAEMKQVRMYVLGA